jgi:hypothetical protein
MAKCPVEEPETNANGAYVALPALHNTKSRNLVCETFTLASPLRYNAFVARLT